MADIGIAVLKPTAWGSPPLRRGPRRFRMIRSTDAGVILRMSSAAPHQAGYERA